MARKTGTSMTYARSGAAARRRRADKQRAEERSWAAKSGPVKIYFRESPQAADLQGDYDGNAPRGSARSSSRAA